MAEMPEYLGENNPDMKLGILSFLLNYEEDFRKCEMRQYSN